ncbi:hypothetical protein MNEG_8041 [Monoraphidium neglectum]|uniref:Uncharacterized protein n=1 Tax=Monoraphidium neglectum TaxID=145388 RepID=A0A0D2MGU1_9CHLO|nr:hypothetical protein MNEG_8041 [Monoraphidium neglectum]KIY99921.1 hypothetical protein MNEG_8041 [Monoraphidium neglectum]|eukprot:XP_013898941.1 hypothetical protein MNEG_8041 [Monoraphidium neglectum]
MSLLAAAISEDGMRVLLAVAREQSQSAIAETRGPRDVFERFMAQGAITPSRLALELLMLIVANTGNDGIAAAARLASSPGMLSDVLAVLAESPPAGAGKPARSASLSYWACACLAEMALRLFPTAVGPATPAEAAVHAPDAPRDGAARFAPHMAAALLASPGALANALANAGCDDDMVAWQALFALSPLAVSHGATAASSPEQQAAAVAALAVCPSRVPAARRLALRTAHTASHLVHSGRAIADAVSDNGGVHPAVELLALTMLCRAPDARDAVIGMPVPLPALLQIVRQRDAITSRLALQLLETLMQGDLGAAPGHPGWPPPPQGPMRGAWPWGAASAAASAAIVAHGDAAGGEGAEVLRAGGAVILAAERARCGGGRACVVCAQGR